MPKTISTVGKNIRKFRKKKGLSQDKLSKLANISHIAVIKIESGAVQSPSIYTVQKIALALGANINDFLK